MKFKSIKEYVLADLYKSSSTFAIQTTSGSLYDECVLHAEYGFAGAMYYYFTTSGVVINASDVERIAFEGSEDKPVLQVYELHLGWRGQVICTAYSLDEAKQIMQQNRDLYDDELDDICVKPLEGYVHVSYGDE